MMLHIIDGKVKCPITGETDVECCDSCDYYEGKKKVYDHELLMCEYYYKRSAR